MASKIPTSPDVWLSREDTAEALTESGYPTSGKTLQTKATCDPSLGYRINARRAEYHGGTVLKWRKSLIRYRGGDQQHQQHQDAAA
jgi:hypothetical protein